jgi:hypothetical protein
MMEINVAFQKRTKRARKIEINIGNGREEKLLLGIENSKEHRIDFSDAEKAVRDSGSGIVKDIHVMINNEKQSPILFTW